MVRKVLYSLIVISLVLVFNQITAGDDAPSTSVPTGTNATAVNAANGLVEVRLSATSADPEITSARLAIASVEVHVPDGWSKMKMEANVVDLKQAEGSEQTVATHFLTQGTYTQIRVSFASLDVSLGNSSPKKAKMTSSMLSFTQNFQVMNKNTTVLVLVFDTSKSIDHSLKDQIVFNPIANLVFTRTPGSLELVTTDLPQGKAGVAYYASLLAIGGLRPYAWSVTQGDLTPGLTLDPVSGVISGVPSAPGSFSFFVRVDDASANRKNTSKNYKIIIS